MGLVALCVNNPDRSVSSIPRDYSVYLRRRYRALSAEHIFHAPNPSVCNIYAAVEEEEEEGCVTGIFLLNIVLG